MLLTRRYVLAKLPQSSIGTSQILVQLQAAVIGQRKTRQDSRISATRSPTWTLIKDVDQSLATNHHSLNEISRIAWSLDKLHMYDSATWETLIRQAVTANSVNPSESALLLFSLSNAISTDRFLLSDALLSEIDAWVRSWSAHPPSLASMDLRDLAQVCYTYSSIFPTSSTIVPFLKQVIKRLEEIPISPAPEELPQLTSCREVSLLWSTARNRKSHSESKLSKSFLEALLEASRGLRLCSDFNQNKVGQLCEAISTLSIDDPRVVYQVVHFVDTHHTELNKKNLLRIVRTMHKLNVNNDILWKRIANRLEATVGLTFSVPELEEVKSAFTALRVANNRISGILDLYIKTKVQANQYGPQ